MQRFQGAFARLSALSRVVGFGASMGLLALTTFLSMPAMMRASGAIAWGAITLGQAVGGVGSVLVGYGWSMSGPAQIAGATATARRRQFLDSLTARLSLFFPVAAISAAIAAILSANDYRAFAAAGAVFSASIGLSSTWYFVGTIQPWTLLASETIPRIVGTLAGIMAMSMGASALVGVCFQTLGMALATAVSATVALRQLANEGADHAPGTGLTTVMRAHWDGVAAAMSASAVGALPIVLVQAINPQAQPLFAFVDKVQRQVTVALTPVITVLQGWVPRGDPRQRARKAMALGGSLCLILMLAVTLCSSYLVELLGGGVIHTSWPLDLSMGLFVGLGTFDLIMSHAVLSTFHRLRFVSVATMWTGAASLLLLIPAVHWHGAIGALLATLLGLMVRDLAQLREGYRVTAESVWTDRSSVPEGE